MRSTTGAPVPVVMSALWDTAVPVPPMRGLCEDDRVNGAPFFVTSHVEAAGGEGLPAAAAGLPGRDELAERCAAGSGRALDGLAYAPPDVERCARSVEVGVHPGSRRRGPGVIATARGS
jgi:hypothetical protein